MASWLPRAKEDCAATRRGIGPEATQEREEAADVLAAVEVVPAAHERGAGRRDPVPRGVDEVRCLQRQ